MNECIPLRTYRLNPRKAWLAVSDSVLAIHLPTYFSKRSWTVNLVEMAVCDLAHLEITPEPAEDDSEVLFEQEIALPYFFTTGPATTPNLALLFSRAQRVPPLRLVVAVAPNVDLPFGYRASRSSSGASIDGMLLRAADSAGATELLRQAGAEVTRDPDEWLRSHRQTVTDPEERARILHGARFNQRLTRVSNGGLGLALGALVMSDSVLPSNFEGPALGVAAASGVVGLGARLMARRAATP